MALDIDLLSTIAPTVFFMCGAVLLVLLCVRTNKSSQQELKSLKKVDNKKETDYDSLYNNCFPCFLPKKSPVCTVTDYFNVDSYQEDIIEKHTVARVPLRLFGTVEDFEEFTRFDDKMEYLSVSEHDESLLPQKSSRFLYQTTVSYASSPQPGDPIEPQVIYPLKILSRETTNRPSDAQEDNLPKLTSPKFVKIPSRVMEAQQGTNQIKREISTQYLNNFSSIFVRNLKDPVPKDPENLPDLSKPFTSKIKDVSLNSKIPTKKPVSSTRGKHNLGLSYKILQAHTKSTEEHDLPGSSSGSIRPNSAPVYSPSNNREKLLTPKTSTINTLKHDQDKSMNENENTKTPGGEIKNLDIGYNFPTTHIYSSGVRPKRINAGNNHVESKTVLTHKTETAPTQDDLKQDTLIEEKLSEKIPVNTSVESRKEPKMYYEISKKQKQRSMKGADEPETSKHASKDKKSNCVLNSDLTTKMLKEELTTESNLSVIRYGEKKEKMGNRVTNVALALTSGSSIQTDDTINTEPTQTTSEEIPDKANILKWRIIIKHHPHDKNTKGSEKE